MMSQARNQSHLTPERYAPTRKHGFGARRCRDPESSRHQHSEAVRNETPEFMRAVNRVESHRHKRMKKDAEIEDFSFDAVKSKMRTTMEVKPKATGQRIWAGAAIMRDESHLESKYMPPKANSDFVTSIVNSKKKFHRGLSLESSSAPTITSNQSSRVSARTPSPSFSKKTKYIQEKNKIVCSISNVKSTPKMPIRTSTSVRLQKLIKQKPFETQKPKCSVSSDMVVDTARKKRASSRIKAELGYQKVQGTADQPIHLASDSEAEAVDLGLVGKMDMNQDAQVAPPSRECKLQLKNCESWIGTFHCRCNILFEEDRIRFLFLSTRSGEGVAKFIIPFDAVMAAYLHISSPENTVPHTSLVEGGSFVAINCKEVIDHSYQISSSFDGVGNDLSRKYVVFSVKDQYIMRKQMKDIHDMFQEICGPAVKEIRKEDRGDYLMALQTQIETESRHLTRPRERRLELWDEDKPVLSSCKMIFTYPLPPCTSDIVTVNSLDLQRLLPHQYLNDNIIDYYFKRIMLERYSNTDILKKNVLFLSSHFYSRLRAGAGKTPNERLKSGYANVSTWLSRADFFNKNIIFVPINKDLHWSLVIIFNPTAATSQNDKHSVCIAMLDPLGNYHNKPSILRNLKSFLLLEWQNTHEDEGATYDISKISSVNVRVPRQENSFDCGVYILKYADYILENFIKLVDQRGNVVEVIEGAVGAKLEPFISKSSFTPADVNEKRNELVADMLDDMTRYSTLGVENEE